MQPESSLGSRIREARKKVGLSQSQLAEKVGVSREAVSQWESNQNTPKTDKIQRIASLTGFSVDYLMLGKGQPSVAFLEVPQASEMPRDVPVQGIAACGPDGAFVFESTTIDYVRRPARIRGIKDAYALYVQGSSMAPWREPGQLVYVHPGRPVAIGDYVVVQTGENGRATAAYIKRLARRTATEIRLEQFTPPESLIIPAKRVISIHRIIDWSELLGI